MPMTTVEPQDQFLSHDGYTTCFLEAGEGSPVLLIHGSGPGVSARANWRGTLASDLTDGFRMIAPDVVGFGQTATPEHMALDHDTRVAHLVSFCDSIALDTFQVIGNSMGGALALALAHRFPDRVERMVLMGAVGIQFPITPELDEVWGYEPSLEAMERVIRLLAHDQTLVNPDLVRMRYEASIAPDVQERYAAAFAAPRQRHADSMALSDDELRKLKTPTLLIHGVRDAVVPVADTSMRMVQLLPNADLVVFGGCGHWTQIERADDFQRHVGEFLRT
jgi:pimeloyl-ACP methyl ester carboxylesterase